MFGIMKKTPVKFSSKLEQKRFFFVKNSEIGPDSETLISKTSEPVGFSWSPRCGGGGVGLPNSWLQLSNFHFFYRHTPGV